VTPEECKLLGTSEEERKEKQEEWAEICRENQAYRARTAHMLGLLRPDMNGLQLLILYGDIDRDPVVFAWKREREFVDSTPFDYVEQATAQQRAELRLRIAG